MATFDRRLDKDGKYVYRARVRRKGYAPQVATFHKLSDTRKWAQVTEVATLEGRHFKTSEANSHTLAELIDRYIIGVQRLLDDRLVGLQGRLCAQEPCRDEIFVLWA